MSKKQHSGASDDTPRIVSSTGGHKLFCKYWKQCLKGGEKPRALVFIAHGFGEHTAWYECFGEPLEENGVLAFMHDHVGHGLSEGYPAHIVNFHTYVDDALQHIDPIVKDHPGVPVFILGHSMGGTIAILMALKRPDFFKGVVLIGPAIEAAKDSIPDWKIKLARVVSWVYPTCPVEKLGPEKNSSDPAVVKKYIEDPLVYHGGLRAGWGMAMLAAVTEVQAKVNENTYPYLLIHGEDDKVCGIAGAEMFHESAPSADKTFSVYPGAYHMVHNEPNGVGQKCVNETVSWIVKRIK